MSDPKIYLPVMLNSRLKNIDYASPLHLNGLTTLAEAEQIAKRALVDDMVDSESLVIARISDPSLVAVMEHEVDGKLRPILIENDVFEMDLFQQWVAETWKGTCA